MIFILSYLIAYALKTLNICLTLLILQQMIKCPSPSSFPSESPSLRTLFTVLVAKGMWHRMPGWIGGCCREKEGEWNLDEHELR